LIKSLTAHEPTVQASLYWWRPDRFYAGLWMSRVDFSDLGDPTTSVEVDVYLPALAWESRRATREWV
jgi:hypothetical protein